MLMDVKTKIRSSSLATVAAMAALAASDGPVIGPGDVIPIRPYGTWKPKPTPNAPRGTRVIIDRKVARAAAEEGSVVIVETSDAMKYAYGPDGVLRRTQPKIRSKKERRRLKLARQIALARQQDLADFSKEE